MELCGAKDENDVEAHDRWLIELWNKTVAKKDEVIIVGDFSLISARKLHPLGWRGIAASLLLIKHYFFFFYKYTIFIENFLIYCVLFELINYLYIKNVI